MRRLMIWLTVASATALETGSLPHDLAALPEISSVQPHSR
jgi:hypothetical protein